MSWDYMGASLFGREDDVCSLCGSQLLGLEEQERGICFSCWEDELNEKESDAETEDYWEEERGRQVY